MIELKNILIKSTSRPTLADVFYFENKEAKPVVLFCHGFKGFKDWGAWGLVAKYFAEKGFVFVKFNLSHNGGTVENPIDFDDLEAFSENTYSKELYDINAMMDWMYSAGFPLQNEEYDLKNIAIIGHSRGGAMVNIQASNDSRIKKISTWASIATLERFGSETIIQDWKEKGVKYIANGRTNQQMPMKIDIYNDYYENQENLSVEKATKELKIPFLIVHGDKDEAVGFSHAFRLKKWQPKASLLKIENTNHVFGAKHPWRENDLPPQLEKVCEATVKFFLEM